MEWKKGVVIPKKGSLRKKKVVFLGVLFFSVFFSFFPQCLLCLWHLHDLHVNHVCSICPPPVLSTSSLHFHWIPVLCFEGLSGGPPVQKLTWGRVYSQEGSPCEHKTDMVSDILWSCLHPWVYVWWERAGRERQQHWDHQGPLYLPSTEFLMRKAPTNAWTAWCCHPRIFYHWSNISRQLL